MKNSLIIFILFLASSLLISDSLYSQIGVDIETGLVRSGYNDVRIPGDTGTLFSFSEDLKADDAIFYRIRLNYSWGKKHTLSILYAPLTINSTGQFDQTVQFEGSEFPSNTPVEGTYKFNSYRLTYRYALYQSETFEFGLGLTGKIRDAEIGLKSDNSESIKDDFGFVPLINFRCFLKVKDQLGLLFSGDALAAPQGRAEDVLIAFTYDISDKLRMKLGYRLLEGGADNDEVYTFSWLNYAVFGLNIHL